MLKDRRSLTAQAPRAGFRQVDCLINKRHRPRNERGVMMIKLICVSGIVQNYLSKEALLEHKNRFGKLYELRGEQLWHKGHRVMVGVVQEV